MRRFSAVNGFVIFESRSLENEWQHAKDANYDTTGLVDKFEYVVDHAKTEQEVHDFFELHPQLLPNVGFYHNGPRGDLIVSKLPLGNDFVTDFAFVTENSQMVEFTCIEIESPSKRLFNRNSEFSRGYLDARQQITDWNLWAQQNMREAMRMFGRLGNWLPEKYYQISLRCILVVGRRSEINTIKRKQRWAAENALRQASLSIMTYDRLLDGMKSSFYEWNKSMLVCTYRDRALHAKSIST